jgi:hypothetical protein
VDIRHNTFAKAHEPRFGFQPMYGAPGSVIRTNVFSGSAVGVYLPPGDHGIIVECNDSWGNDENWKGADLLGVDGNFSLAPLYCDPDAGDFRVASTSPLLPSSNPCHTPIGAFGNGCLILSVESMSWGAIKARYR